MATHADVTLTLLNDADAAERDALGLLRVHHQPGRAPHRRVGAAAPRAGPAARGTSIPADCRRPADQLTMTLLHEPPAAARHGRSSTCTSVNPGDRIPDDKVIVSRPMSHPKYTFDTLDGQDAIGALQGHRRTFYAGAHLGYGFHEDGCRSGFEAAEMDRRSWPPIARDDRRVSVAAVAPARGQGAPSTIAADGLRAGARRLLPRARPRRDRRRWTSDCGSFSRNRRNVLTLRDRDHWVPQATDLRASVHDPPARPRASTRRAGASPSSPRRACSATSSTRPASTSAATRLAVLQVVIVEVHNTHDERRLYTLRPERRGKAWVDAMDKDFYVSPFIDMDAHYTVRVQDDPDRLRIAITETEHGKPLLTATLVAERCASPTATCCGRCCASRWPHRRRSWLSTFTPGACGAAASTFHRHSEVTR